MAIDMTEFDEGSVHVRIKSKRGTETRDEDEVIVQALFKNMETAESESQRLNQIVKERLLDARKVTNPPEELEMDIEFTEQNVEESTMRNVDENTINTKTTSESHDENRPKIYLGAGSRLGGWIPIPREVIFDKIAPLVTNNQVEDSEPNIQVNFSKGIPLSGWSTIDETVVLNEIEPIVQKYRRDGSREKDTQVVGCPVNGCSYKGDINQTIGHINGSGHSVDKIPVIECPVEGCSFEGPLGSVGGHFHAKRDDKHETEILTSLDIFKII
jgi:hypothetical protein